MVTTALFAFALACIVVCSFLRTRRAGAFFAISVFLILAVGVPCGEVALKCLQAPTSEGCVWSKSLLPISVGVGMLIGGVFGGVVWFMALGFQRRRRNASGATDSSHALEDR